MLFRNIRVTGKKQKLKNKQAYNIVNEYFHANTQIWVISV